MAIELKIYFLQNDNVFEMVGVKNKVTGVPIDGGTASMTVKDVGGSSVQGEDWPLSLEFIEPGTFRGIAGPDLTMTPGEEYFAVVDVLGPNGEKGHWEEPIESRVRSSRWEQRQ